VSVDDEFLPLLARVLKSGQDNFHIKSPHERLSYGLHN
jgi:hypothetical protein